MSGFYRNALNAILFYVVAALAVPFNAVASGLCTGLPASKLEVFDVKAPGVEVQKVPPEQLDQKVQPEIIGARHTTVLSASNVVAFFEITHRMVPRDDGSVCDAPKLVRIGFGSSRRTAFLTEAAADDKCVREEMLNHEAAHTRAFDSIVDQFIDERQPSFERAMIALKQTPAPNAEIASARWNEGLQLIVTQAKQQLMIDLLAASAQVDDSPVLAALDAACGGKVRELGRRGLAKP
jgi:hypothetical protein